MKIYSYQVKVSPSQLATRLASMANSLRDMDGFTRDLFLSSLGRELIAENPDVGEYLEAIEGGVWRAHEAVEKLKPIVESRIRRRA